MFKSIQIEPKYEYVESEGDNSVISASGVDYSLSKSVTETSIITQLTLEDYFSPQYGVMDCSKKSFRSKLLR